MAIAVEGDQGSVDSASQRALDAAPANMAVLEDPNGFSGSDSPAAMTELSTYALEPLRKDAEFVLYRGRRDADPSRILVVAPVSEQPAQWTLRRLEHEYALRTELDPGWTASPLALVSEKGRTVLALKDPGGEPLDRVLEQPLELTQFLRIAKGSPADVIYWLGKGIVDLYRPTNDGNLPLLRMAGPGEIIGYFDSFDKNGNLVHAFEARARTHCQVILVTRQNINNVLQTLERTKLIELLWHLNRAWSAEALRWIILTTSDCRQRLKLAVADLAARFGARDARGILLVPEVSHQDFANLVGCSRAMASRLIVEMIETGDLVREGGHYIVANGSELAT